MNRVIDSLMRLALEVGIIWDGVRGMSWLNAFLGDTGWDTMSNGLFITGGYAIKRTEMRRNFVGFWGEMYIYNVTYLAVTIR